MKIYPLEYLIFQQKLVEEKVGKAKINIMTNVNKGDTLSSGDIQKICKSGG